MGAKGFAVIHEGQIDVRTVSPTEMGAMVNWLTAACRILPVRGVADSIVRQAFHEQCDLREARLVPVSINAVEH